MESISGQGHQPPPRTSGAQEGRAAPPQTTCASAPRESRGEPGRSQEERQAPTRRRTPPPPDLDGRTGGAAPSSGQQLDEQAGADPGADPHPRRKPIHPGPPLVVLLDPFLEPVDPLVQRGVGAGLLQGNVADGAGHVVEAAAERVERGRDAALLLDDLEDRVGWAHRAAPPPISAKHRRSASVRSSMRTGPLVEGRRRAISSASFASSMVGLMAATSARRRARSERIARSDRSAGMASPPRLSTSLISAALRPTTRLVRCMAEVRVRASDMAGPFVMSWPTLA